MLEFLYELRQEECIRKVNGPIRAPNERPARLAVGGRAAVGPDAAWKQTSADRGAPPTPDSVLARAERSIGYILRMEIVVSPVVLASGDAGLRCRPTVRGKRGCNATVLAVFRVYNQLRTLRTRILENLIPWPVVGL